MSSTSELARFAAHLRESMLLSKWGATTALNSPTGAGEADFEALALQLFALQFKHNVPYRRLCEARGARPDTVARWTDIPAAPTSAFKEFDLSCLPAEERTTVFHSSGTTGQKPSRHYHNAASLALYEASALRWFAAHFQLPIANCQSGEAKAAPAGKLGIGNWRLAILTPPPAQAPHSSLVHMFETIRRECGSGGSTACASDGRDQQAIGSPSPPLEERGRERRHITTLNAAVRSELPAGCRTNSSGTLNENDGLLSLPLSSKGGEGNSAGAFEHRESSKKQSEDSPFVGTANEDGAWTLDTDAALKRLKEVCLSGKLLLMLGTAFSLVHLLDYLAKQDLRFELSPGSCALETGGYKGRSRSLSKAALHALISERLGIPPAHIVCEYGMSELSSQAYDSANSPSRFTFHASPSTLHAPRSFRFPPWARVQIISPETGCEVAEGETGLIRVFDLANVYSVMAIQTEDLGIRRGNGFALAGRAVLAEPRGCSLLAV